MEGRVLTAPQFEQELPREQGLSSSHVFLPVSQSWHAVGSGTQVTFTYISEINRTIHENKNSQESSDENMIEIWRKRLIILNRVVRDGLAQDGTFKMRLKEQEKGRLAKVEKRGF